MSAADRLRIAASLISLAAFAALLWLSAPLWKRGGQLVAHLQSGNWAVSGGNKPIDSALLQKYPQPSEGWKIAYMAGSGGSFPLDDSRRADSINDLGDYLYTSDVIARRTTTRLSAQYAALVDRSNRADGIAPAVWAEAKTALETFQNDLGSDFDRYPVDTAPSAESLANWNANPVQLPQSARCVGTVRGYRSDAGLAADISIHPRYRLLPFDRPWYVPALVDAAARSSDPRLKSFVTGNGPLAEIPEELAVILPDGVIIRVPARLAEQKTALLRSGDCCRVECLGITFDLVSGSARPLADGTIMGRRNAPDPYVYALISRRRGDRR